MDALFRNHLSFFRLHRGDFFVAPDAVYIVAEAPGVTSWVPLSDAAERPADFDAVRLIPESGDEWPDRLQEAGFQPAESLSYQEFALDRQLTPRAERGDYEVHVASSPDDAQAFAEVQSAAFLEGGDGAEDRWWREFFPWAALRNYVDSNQDLLMIREDGTAVAVLLLVYDEDVAGIYAVATRPEYRNRGLSTGLLNAGLERARQRGLKRAILQAMCGSFADGFYRRAGFEERYVSTVWRRTAA